MILYKIEASLYKKVKLYVLVCYSLNIAIQFKIQSSRYESFESNEISNKMKELKIFLDSNLS